MLRKIDCDFYMGKVFRWFFLLQNGHATKKTTLIKIKFLQWDRQILAVLLKITHRPFPFCNPSPLLKKKKFFPYNSGAICDWKKKNGEQ